MVRLRVSKEDAIRLIRSIPHSKCTNAINNQWVVKNETVQAQSVCWLFCWGKTGLNSPLASDRAMDVLNEIMDISFDDFDSMVDHEWARDKRYKKYQDIEDDFNKLIGQ